MNASWNRAVTRLSFAAAALIALGVLGQPIKLPISAPPLPIVLSQLGHLPLAGGLLAPATTGLATDADCDAAEVAASATAPAASEALLRSAVRMRWLLTSPHASSRGCAAPGCTG